MKGKIERRKPVGLLDYLSLAITTFGVGYLPLAPGTWGSVVAVLIYSGISYVVSVQLAFSDTVARIWPLPESSSFGIPELLWAWLHVIVVISLLLFSFLGIWASGRSTELFGNSDPSEAVVDEVIGQLIVFLFVPFGIGWPFILAGFLLFRLFDIWKPYPIDSLQSLPGGIGVCGDDIVAGVYAGVCLAVIYAVSLSI